MPIPTPSTVQAMTSPAMPWATARIINPAAITRFEAASPLGPTGGEPVRLRRRFCLGLSFEILHHVDQHLGRAQIGAGGFVDQLRDDRLSLGDPSPPSVRRDVSRLGDQKRRQVFLGSTARVAGLALLEAGVRRRLALVGRAFALRLGHASSCAPLGSDAVMPIAAKRRQPSLRYSDVGSRRVRRSLCSSQPTAADAFPLRGQRRVSISA
jgi:hypothetical protein